MGNKASSKEIVPKTDGPPNLNVKPGQPSNPANPLPAEDGSLPNRVKSSKVSANPEVGLKQADRVLTLSPEYLNTGNEQYLPFGSNRPVEDSLRSVQAKEEANEQLMGLGSSFDPKSWIKATHVEDIDPKVGAGPPFERRQNLIMSSMIHPGRDMAGSPPELIQNPEFYSAIDLEHRPDPFVADNSPIKPVRHSGLDSPHKLQQSAFQYSPHEAMGFESQIRAPSPKNYRDVSSRLLTIKSKLEPVSPSQSKRNLLKPSSVKITIKKSERTISDVKDLRAEGRVLESEIPAQPPLLPLQPPVNQGGRVMVESVMFSQPQILQPLESTIQPVDLRNLHLLGENKQEEITQVAAVERRGDMGMFESIAELSSNNEKTSQVVISEWSQPKADAKVSSSNMVAQMNDGFASQRSQPVVSQVEYPISDTGQRQGLPQSLLRSRDNQGFGESIVQLSDKTKIELAKVPQSLELGSPSKGASQGSVLETFKVQALEDPSRFGWQPKFAVFSSPQPANLETYKPSAPMPVYAHQQLSPEANSPQNPTTDTLFLSVSRPSPKPRSQIVQNPQKPQKTPISPPKPTQTPLKSSKKPLPSVLQTPARKIVPNLDTLAHSLMQDPYILGL